MRYSDALSKGFATLRSKSLWGFVLTAQFAQFAVLVGTLSLATIAVGPGRVAEMFRVLSAGKDPSAGLLQPMLVLFGAFFVAALFTIPLALITRAGTIHLSDEVQSGRPVTVGQGWAFGLSRLGRTFLVQLAGLVMTTALMIVTVIPIAIVAIAAEASGGSPAVIIGVVCGLFLFLLLILLMLLLLGAYLSIAIRYALIGDRTAGNALSAGWQATRARFKNVVLWSLIVIGVYLVVYGVQMTISFVLQSGVSGVSAFGSTGSGDLPLTTILLTFVVSYSISFAIAVAWMLTESSLWTAFFRQLTGIEPVVPPAGYGYPPRYEVAYAPPLPPESAEFAAPPAPPVQGAIAGEPDSLDGTNL